MKKKVIVISHVHQDREWYFPFQDFRARLEETIEGVLKNLKKYPEFKFQLDGQVVPLLDFLQTNPAKKEEIRKYVKEGRLVIGPSFVLPDEFLLPGEALLRNLEYGISLAKSFGGCYRIGYYPDTFGHISQLPQIFKSLGFLGAPIWRGVSQCLKEQRDLVWEGSDGSMIYTYWFDRALGYSNAVRLVEKRGKFYLAGAGYLEKGLMPLEKFLKEEFEKSRTRAVVLMNGTDHTQVQMEPYDQNIVWVVRKLKAKFPRIEFVFGTFEDYFKEVIKTFPKIERAPLERIRGEQNSGSRYTHLLPGTYSTRLRQVKQPLWESFGRLMFAEFAVAFAARRAGFKIPSGRLTLAWKYLLLNAPHDSLCGSSTDQVHKDMEYRFDQAKLIADKIIEKALRAILDVTEAPKPSGEELGLWLFNSLGFPRGLIRTTIEIPQNFGRFRLCDKDGQEVDYQILASKKKRSIKEAGRFPQAEVEDVVEYEVLIKTLVPQTGFSCLRIKPAKKTSLRKKNSKLEKNTLRNRNLKVVINDDGTFNITDLRSGVTHKNCHYFLDVGDRGDEYNFSHLEKDLSISTLGQKATVVCQFQNETGTSYKVEYILMLPTKLLKNREKRSRQKVKLKLTSFVSLWAEAERVEIVTEFENKACDHRLRVVFPTKIKTDYSLAAMPFDLVKRKIRKVEPIGKNQGEETSNSFPHQGFFVVTDGKNGLGVVAQGLPEYEVARDKKGHAVAALTLVRSVGWLSRGDLLTRRGNAGPEIEAKEAQELGLHRVKYALVPLAQKNWIAKMFKEAGDHNFPVVAVVEKRGEKTQKAPKTKNCLLSKLPDGLVLSSVRHLGAAIYLRIFNPTSNPVSIEPAKLLFGEEVKVFEANLNNEVIRVAEKTARINPGKIVTFCFSFDRGGV